MKSNRIVSYFWCCVTALAVFCLQFCVSFFASESGITEDSVYIVLTQVFALALPCFLVYKLKKTNPIATFGLYPVKRNPVVLSIVFGIAMQPVAMILNIPVKWLVLKLGGEVEYVYSTPPADGAQILEMLFAVCLVPAVFEELFARGMLLNSLKRYGFKKAVLISSVIFAMLHNNIESLPGVLFLGVGLGICVFMTGSVLYGMIAHFAFNGTGVLIDYFLNTYHQLNSVGLIAIFAVAGILICCFCIFRFYNRKRWEFYEENSVYRPVSAFVNLPLILMVSGYIIHIFL